MKWENAEILGLRIYAFSEITRFAVPVFLMMSGALLLNRKMSILDFFKRRFSRLCYPYIFYLIIYVVVLFFFMTSIPGFEGLAKYFNYIPLKYNWYFWMILSIYFSIPIIDIFIRNAEIKEIEYFVAMALIGSLFYQFTLYFKIGHFIDLNFFICPLTFMILGYYLSIKDFKSSPNKIITIAIIIFLITTALKVMSQMDIIPYNLIHNYSATRSPIVSSYLDMGFVQLIQAGSFFVIFKYIYQAKSGIYSKVRKVLENSLLEKINLSVSKSSYGMYLFHHTLLEPLEIFLPTLTLTGSQVCISIVLLSLGVFVVSWIVVLIVNKIPYLNIFSGYH